MKTKLLALALAAASPLALAVPAAAQTLPAAVIIIVNTDRIIGESAAGKQAQSEIAPRVQALQARVTALKTQFGTESQTLGKSQPPASPVTPARTAWEAKVRDLQTRQAQAEQEIGQRDRDLQNSAAYVRQQINDAVQPIISTVMKERGASIVIPEGATLQHNSSIDVTNDVLARLNTALPRVSTTAPAAPAAK